MILTRRFGALAARPQFPDAPELRQELAVDAELLQAGEAPRRHDEQVRTADESAA